MIDSSRQDLGIFEIQCDSCDDATEYTAADFQDFIDRAKSDGWTMKKNGEEWAHHCSECSKPMQRLRLATANRELREAAQRVMEVFNEKEPGGCGTAAVARIAGAIANLGRKLNAVKEALNQ